MMDISYISGTIISVVALMVSFRSFRLNISSFAYDRILISIKEIKDILNTTNQQYADFQDWRKMVTVIEHINRDFKKLNRLDRQVIYGYLFELKSDMGKLLIKPHTYYMCEDVTELQKNFADSLQQNPNLLNEGFYNRLTPSEKQDARNLVLNSVGYGFGLYNETRSIPKLGKNLLSPYYNFVLSLDDKKNTPQDKLIKLFKRCDGCLGKHIMSIYKKFKVWFTKTPYEYHYEKLFHLGNLKLRSDIVDDRDLFFKYDNTHNNVFYGSSKLNLYLRTLEVSERPY